MAEGKWISGLTASTPVVEAARRVLHVRLEAVHHHLKPALHESDKDPEHVHQLRVATRRAGAALEIFGACLPGRVHKRARRRLRGLRRAAAAARDWDVFLITLADRGQRAKQPSSGSDLLLGYALGQRHAAQAQLATAGSELSNNFPGWPPDVMAAAHEPQALEGTRTLLDLARPMLAGLLAELDEAAAQDLNDYNHLHRVRIIGKRLRYAMEVFVDCFPSPFRETLYPAVEEMQEILGRANDSHVASGRLAALRERLRVSPPGAWRRLRPAVEGLLRFHQRRLPRERRHFQAWWDRWRKADGRTTFAALLQME